MARFCNSGFWNNQIVQKSDSLKLTQCFREVAIVGPSTLLFILSAICYIVYFRNKKSRRVVSKSYTFMAKTVLMGILFILFTVKLAFEIHWARVDKTYDTAGILSSVCVMTGMAVSQIVLLRERKKKIISSPIIFGYLFFLVLSSILDMNTIYSQNEVKLQDKITGIISTLSLLLSSLGLVLTAIRDDSYLGEDKKVIQAKSSSFFSQMIYWWCNRTLINGYKSYLRLEDIWELPRSDTVQSASSKYQACLLKLKKSEKHPPVSRILFRAFGPTFLVGTFLKLLHDILAVTEPVILGLILNFLQNPTKKQWEGYFYVFLLLFLDSLKSLLVNRYFHICSEVQLKIRASLTTELFRKIMRLPPSTRATSGSIINHMSVDTQSVSDLMMYVNILWSGPFQLSVVIFLLWQKVGVASLGCISILGTIIPILSYISNKSKQIIRQKMVKKDVRIKIISDILEGIKLIKLYAWENAFLTKVRQVRRAELALTKKNFLLFATSRILVELLPIFMLLATIAVYSRVKGSDIEPEMLFVVISLINIARFCMMVLPNVISQCIQAHVSIKRINKFLAYDELETNNIERIPPSEIAVEISDGSFSYGETLILEKINLKITRGQTVGIIGKVGSGKTSLLSAMMGEISRIQGSVGVSGTTVYVPQSAWIRNMTIRENITMFEEFDEARYLDIMSACCLNQDLNLMESGDLTEIGEKGVNLSGGQKQRINLARALYSNADIYYLDDVLSAVDPQVGKSIYENVFDRLLGEKTVVFATNNMEYLHSMDWICVVENGIIVAMGTLEELKENPVILKNLIKERVADEGECPVGEDLAHFDRHGRLPTRKLVEDEHIQETKINYGVFKSFVLATGIKMLSLCLAFYGVTGGVKLFSTIWLTKWSDDTLKGTPVDGSRRLMVYGLTVGLFGLSLLVKNVTNILSVMNAALELHNKLITAIMHFSYNFFERIPTGRILNRFSRDINVIDEKILNDMSSCLGTFVEILSVAIVVSISNPYFLLIMLPLILICVAFQRIFIKSSRQIKRLESLTKSPIFSLFSETFHGVSTIRSFGIGDKFAELLERNLDTNNKCLYTTFIANRWLSVRLEFMGIGIVFLTSLFPVALRGKISPGFAGIAITYAMSSINMLNWLVRSSSEFENDIVAVERVKEYIDLPQEPSWDSQGFNSESWPSRGEISFQNYSAMYDPNLRDVLSDLNIDIRGGEKIGVIGRTGSGKSSLTLSLFRCIEVRKGSIRIDGLDISSIGLHDLRKKITIVTQDSVIFVGTLRFNLDPFDEYSDEEIIDSLEKVDLREEFATKEGFLQFECMENGKNLSGGQRQLICLARALLRRNKILVLDEATAAVDVHTDQLIQKTIRKSFKDCTVITIAHRINTVIDYDRILVLSNGALAEFDSPRNLLANESSLFYKLCNEK